MADVKTVDIDGSQWSMKDQEARNKVFELKSEIKYKIVVTEEIINSDIAITKKSPEFSAYFATLKINNKPTSNAILFQVTQPDEIYQGLIISVGGKSFDLLLSSESQMIIPSGFKLKCFWLTPITE